MKNKLNQLRERLLSSAFYQKAPRPVRWIIGSLSYNLGMKLLSLLLAILLWNYVINSNTSITLNKTVYNITGVISGQTALADNKLALTEDPAQALTGISVTVEAPQAYYSRVSPDNIQVTLDLSNVRSPGTQEVPLRASSTYGRVRSISPDAVTVHLETLDSRNVAVNSTFVRQAEGYWYNVTRTNPTMLTVSGAASVVQSIASARVTANVSGLSSSVVTAVPYVLLDSAGNEIPQTLLKCSTSSVSLSIDIFPCREIPVSTDPASVLTGSPAEGYVLQSVSVQPESIQVAAERELLDSLDALMIEPVSIEGANQSFSARAKVSQLSDFKNVSSEQVYVNIGIAEASVKSYVDNVKVQFVGKAENLIATYEPLGVFVTGPQSQVEALQESGLNVAVDITGYEDGYYLLDPSIEEERYPDLVFESEAVSVTLTSINSETEE